MGTTEWIIVVLVVGGRLALPLLIPYFPVPALLACLILDSIDQSIFQQFPAIPLDGYQSYDKALDIYYLSVAYLSTLRNWTNQGAFRMSQFLYYYRMIGVVAFELTQNRTILFIFPNTFEYFFLFVELVRLGWNTNRMGKWTVILATAGIWIFIKLPQEWWIHIAQLDMTDFIKETLFGVAATDSWATAIANRPWVLIAAIAVFAALAAIVYWIITRKAPPFDHKAHVKADPLPPLLRGAEPYRKVRAESSIFGWALREKVALTAIVCVIFGLMLTGGEARPLRGPGRREVGHGTLAEKAIMNVLPPESEFPYTLRVVAETLESNGSSSMATVCGATLSLMDAGVPIKAPVAGIAMGLIEDGARVAILSDILGDEDHLGDMDFKVAGTRNGVTAVQMDIKVRSIDWSVMERALEQARVGRLHILDCMESETRDVLGGKFEARTEVANHAPRMSALWIKPDRIRDIIGPGGRVIRAIQEATGAKIDIEDNGQVKVFAPDRDQLDRARAMIEELTQEAEIGRVYLGKVKRIADFGAFVEIFPGTDGLIHISHLAEARIEKVTDVLNEGDEVLAKCIDIDPTGRIRLSRKEALADLAAQPQE